MSHIYSNDDYTIDNIPTIKRSWRSHFIPQPAVDVIINRVEIWMANGYAFNKQITINFEQFGGMLPHPHLTRFLQSMRKWHARRNLPFVYFWVLEVDPIVGLHAHILIHTDITRWNELDAAMSNWLPFERDDLPGRKNTDFHTDDAKDIGALHYRLKGLDKRHQPLGRWHEYTGFIKGKRWGMSKGPYGRRS